MAILRHGGQYAKNAHKKEEHACILEQIQACCIGNKTCFIHSVLKKISFSDRAKRDLAIFKGIVLDHLVTLSDRKSTILVF